MPNLLDFPAHYCGHSKETDGRTVVCMKLPEHESYCAFDQCEVKLKDLLNRQRRCQRKRGHAGEHRLKWDRAWALDEADERAAGSAS